MAILEAQLEKIKSFCAYQERSHREVRSKLLEMEVYGADLEQAMVALIEENYLNEERFARALAGGKFRMKQWGRLKIRQALKQHQVSEYCIRKGMEEIDDDVYEATFNRLAEQKWQSLRGERNRFTRMAKLRNYLMGKGYEPELFYAFLRKQGEEPSSEH